MKVIKKQLADLKRPEKNVRMHNDKQIQEFRRSIEMFGQIRPIVIDEDNTILAGNGLYETLLSMGRKEADCYVVKGLDEKGKKKLMLADNRIFNLGVDDISVFDEFMRDLKDDLDIPGFDEDMLKSLVMDLDEANVVIADYGLISDEQAEEMREAGEKAEARYDEIAENAIEHTPAQVPDEVREAADYAEPYKADGEDIEHRYILCPKCGERIWL